MTNTGSLVAFTQRERVGERPNATLLSRFKTLPDAQQKVLRLRLMSGLTYREIAEIVGGSVAQVSDLIHEGLKALRTTQEGAQ